MNAHFQRGKLQCGPSRVDRADLENPPGQLPVRFRSVSALDSASSAFLMHQSNFYDSPSFILVIEPQSFDNHRDDLCDSLRLGFFSFGIGNVVRIFALLAFTEFLETCMRIFIFCKRFLELWLAG